MGLRCRFCGFGGFGAGAFAGPSAGTSALIGRVIAGNANAWPDWLAGQLSSWDWLTDQSINELRLRVDEGDGWISH